MPTLESCERATLPAGSMIANQTRGDYLEPVTLDTLTTAASVPNTLLLRLEKGPRKDRKGRLQAAHRWALDLCAENLTPRRFPQGSSQSTRL